MQPLTEKQKAWAYRNLLHGTSRRVAEPAYRALLTAQLSWHRLSDGLFHKRPVPARTQNLTALIKTFERPGRCRALVRSLQRLYPNLPIVVVDDSRDPVRLPGVLTLVLPYDSGVAAGRSAGLEQVATEYVLNLDDDFVAFKGTDIASALDLMHAYPEIGLMGGQVIDLPLYASHPSRNAALFEHAAAPVVPAGERIGGMEVQDKVANFFIARTDQVRKIGWDATLKRLDHADFFTRAKGRLLSVYNPSLRVLHVKNPFDDAYREKRYAIDGDLAYLAQKYAEPWPEHAAAPNRNDAGAP